jgi:hypothetical protein
MAEAARAAFGLEIRAMDKHLVANSWVTMCRTAQAHAMHMAEGHPGAAAEMMLSETSKFCDQGPPRTGDELDGYQMQRLALLSMISAMAHGDLMAREHPSVAGEIFEEIRKLRDHALPNTDDGWRQLHDAILDSGFKIYRICHRTLTQRFQ